MKVLKKIVIAVVAVLLAAVLIGGPTVYAVRGSLRGIEVTREFTDGLDSAKTQAKKDGDVRIMSSNLLVHYKSWGGEPAKPRAAMYLELLKVYQPDVIGVQEVSDEWFCCLNRNLPDGYKFLYPFTTGLFVNMTGLIYNSNTVTLVESGKQEFSQGDNPRLRRVVWGVFERKADGKRFAVTSTHLDLIRENKEKEQLAIMNVQSDEMIKIAEELCVKYACPVFSTGDFNAMENGDGNGIYDAPEIYEKLAASMKDTKNMAQKKLCGDAQGLTAPTYDHVFLTGEAEIKCYQLLSSSYVKPLSDHFPLFIDADIQ